MGSDVNDDADVTVAASKGVLGAIGPVVEVETIAADAPPPSAIDDDESPFCCSCSCGSSSAIVQVTGPQCLLFLSPDSFSLSLCGVCERSGGPMITSS